MTSSEQVHIEQVSPQTVSETTPLVKTKPPKQSKRSLIIKSKAVVMILIWTALLSVVYGAALNPEVYYNYISILLSVSQSSSILAIEISIALYALFAIWLLFYPLAGCLADVRFGRYKVVKCSVFTAWCGLFIPAIIIAVVCAIFVPVLTVINSSYNYYPTYNNLLISLFVIVSVVAFCWLLSWLIAFAGFLANVIQFGVDQLVDSPARDSFLFIHWFLFAIYIGISIGKLMWNIGFSSNDFIRVWSNTGYILLLFSLPVISLLVIIIFIPITLCIAKKRWFLVDIGTGNPYEDVAQVVGFARRNKIPIQRSAFTFYEDDIPTGLDLGKQKYGGPFTTEQVENVKSFFGIVVILLSLGPFFTADIAATLLLGALRNHMEIFNPRGSSFDVSLLFNSIFLSSGALYPLFIVIIIPIFLKFIYPLFEKYFPGSLKRIGVGLCLITLTLFCSMFMDTIGHILPAGQNATSIFANTYFTIDKSLQMNPSFLIIQQVLIAVAYVLIYGGVYEFICAQSPHSMKGFLIGISFATKGFFQLIGVFGILLPFSFWHDSPRVGLVYFLVNILISVFGVVVFTVAAKRYQYRQRDELCNERQYIEEVFEKDVRHNEPYDDLDVHFDTGSDSETNV